MAAPTSRSDERGEAEDPLGYDKLPMSIRMAVSEREYAWLGAQGRARLVQDLTENDWEEP